MHTSEKKNETKSICLNTASKYGLFNNIPVPKRAHGILEWPESMDI